MAKDVPLRDWASSSYSSKTGKPASAFDPGTSKIEGMTVKGNSQIDAARAPGSGKGNPGVSAMNKSGSADPGRRKWGGSSED
jgi:hypothetical protein